MEAEMAAKMDEENIFEVNHSFYEKYNSTIRGIVANILNPANLSQDIDDCVNNVFLNLMEKLMQYNETRGSLAAFVIVIARSTALDYRRNGARKNGELINNDRIDFLCEPVDFENEVEFDMLVKKIILEKLNNGERRLYTMKYVLFDPPEEIAKAFHAFWTDAEYLELTAFLNEVFGTDETGNFIFSDDKMHLLLEALDNNEQFGYIIEDGTVIIYDMRDEEEMLGKKIEISR